MSRVGFHAKGILEEIHDFGHVLAGMLDYRGGGRDGVGQDGRGE